jgi:filamentous hemagglutinin family protein
MKPQLFFVLLIISLSAPAQIITDNTLGPALQLPGPNYQIGSDLGQQHGGNLFHSFKDFNLNSAESATFSGPNYIQNVISRVTGGNPSNIDGTIRSLIPNADFYFLNPYGILFGPNARLDVQGSFHATTADYFRLGNNGRFNARHPNESLLTVAPIEAFGFLTNNPAPITTQDSELSVLETQTLSLIGGDIDLSGHSPIKFDEQGFMAIFAQSKLSAPAGRINLVSVASAGEMIPTESGFNLNAKGGTIQANNTLVELSGRGGGSVFIRGGRFVMRESTIQANTQVDQHGKGIDIKLTENVKIKGNLLAISSKTFGQGDAGQVIIITPHLEVSGSLINTGSLSEGHAGSIQIAVNQLELKEGSSISSRNYDLGKSGDIEIQATQQISLSGQRLGNYQLDGLLFQQYPTIINSTTIGPGAGGQVTIVTGLLELNGGLITTASLGKGNAGNLTIDTNAANLNHGSIITTNGMVEGQSGHLKLTVKDRLLITGKRSGFYITPTGMVLENNQSSIATLTLSNNQASQAGDILISADTIQLENGGLITASNVGQTTTIGGNILITANNLLITQGGQINNSNGIFMGNTFVSGLGHGGTITIKAQNISILGMDGENNQTGILSDTYSEGQGGNIEIQTTHLDLKQNGNLSAHSHAIGNAGEITVQANTIILTKGGNISTSATNAAGGHITITVPHFIYLQKGEITTSVGIGKGSGGDITIEPPIFIISDQGNIRANANEGRGGNIHIVAGQFIASPDSLVSASSILGLDGNVEIDSPDQDIIQGMSTLSTIPLDASSMMKTPCEAMSYEDYQNRLRFMFYPIAGSTPSPYDLQPSRLSSQSASKLIQKAPNKAQKSDQQTRRVPPRQIALLMMCKPSKAQSETENRVMPDQLF